MTNWIISSSALIILLMLVRLVFREKMSQRLRYALWLLVLIRLLVPFSLGETEISIDNFTEKAVMSEGGQIISEIGNINLHIFTPLTYYQISIYNKYIKTVALKAITKM